MRSHNVDCLYVVIGGPLKLGMETLGRGDGFFVPAGTPYTYLPGGSGVEVLEFRTANRFDIWFLAQAAAPWSKAEGQLKERSEAWAVEAPHIGLGCDPP